MPSFSSYNSLGDSISSGEIEDESVTTAKIAAFAVATGRIANGAVGNAKLAAGAVTSDKLAAGVVALNKVSEVEITGSATDEAEFTGLDIDTDGVYFIEANINNSSGSSAQNKIYINGDTTDANYNSQYLASSGSSASAANYSVPYLTGTLSTGTSVSMNIRIALDPLDNFCYNTQYVQGADMSLWSGSLNSTTANITSILIKSTVATGFAVGSKFTLYKLAR